jgi:hypothetical protein
VPEGQVDAIGVGFAMSGELAAVFSPKFYAPEPALGNKHPKRVIDLLVSLDASHISTRSDDATDRELHSTSQVIAGRSPNENSVMAFTVS